MGPHTVAIDKSDLGYNQALSMQRGGLDRDGHPLWARPEDQQPSDL